MLALEQEKIEQEQIANSSNALTHGTAQDHSTYAKQKAEKQIGPALNLYRGYSLNIRKIQEKTGKEIM